MVHINVWIYELTIYVWIYKFLYMYGYINWQKELRDGTHICMDIDVSEYVYM